MEDDGKMRAVQDQSEDAKTLTQTEAQDEEETPETPLERWERKRIGDLPSVEAADTLLRELEQKHPPSALRLQVPIALIGSDDMARKLATVCDLRTPRPEDDELGGAELLIVECCILDYGNPWRRAVLDLRGEAELLDRMIARARSLGVPVLAWMTEEMDGIGHFHRILDAADLVVAHEPVDCRTESMIVPGMVDTTAFNPIRRNSRVPRFVDPYFAIVIDGTSELREQMDVEDQKSLFAPVRDWNWWCIDSGYRLRNNNQKLNPIFRRRFLGSFLGNDVAAAMRSARFYVLPSPMTRTRRRFSLGRALEAQACGSLVLTDDPDFGLPFVARFDGAQPDDATSGLGGILRNGLSDTVGHDVIGHLGWRKVMSEHTVLDIVMAFLDRLGVPPRLTQSLTPRINVVMPTMRPELIPLALETWQQQSYPEFSLTIVVNGLEVPAETRTRVEASGFATLHDIPRHRSIGYCMNYGIDQSDADYWAKVDDDDLYGANFLSDLMLQRKYVDFDVVGKSAHFSYQAGVDRIFLRQHEKQHTADVFVTGGSLVAKAGGVGFPEDIRGYADTMFLLNAKQAGATILSSDIFNFVQVRRADLSSHTWTAGSDKMTQKIMSRPGFSLEGIFI